MKYNTVNEFEHFEFHEVHVSDVEVTNGFFHIILDDVIILPENTCNRDIRKMRANGLLLKIQEMKIEGLCKEGYRTYDANGNLLGQTEDEAIPEEKWPEIFALFADSFAYSIEKNENKYTFVVDATDESTYSLVVSGSGDTEEWDKFLNLE